MQDNIWNKINRYVDKHEMICEGDFVAAGLSGGADSVCLIRYLLDLKARRPFSFCAVHIDHMLRGQEAERDRRYVELLCGKWKIPLVVFQRDIRKISREIGCSLEETGRKIRYKCFREALKGRSGGKIAVAHHANDLAETMLFRMVRGTGPEGLVGMRPVDGDVIRPLLGVKRQEIMDILRSLGQDYVEDGTNQDPGYSRNYIRLRIIPEMESLNPKAVDHLCTLAEQTDGMWRTAANYFDKVYAETVRRLKGRFLIKKEPFYALGEYERQEIARRALYAAAEKRKDISSVHVCRLAELMENRLGKRLDLPYEICALRVEEGLLLERRQEGAGENQKKIPCTKIDLPPFEEGKTWAEECADGHFMYFRYESYQGQKIEKKDCVKYFDYDKIKCKLSVRTRRHGDYFIMNRAGQRKMLNRYFINEKIPAEERDKKLLLADGGHIMWVIGARISEEYKISAGTTRMIIVESRVKEI